MKYKSTRSDAGFVSASEAICKGIAEDGGLFVPDHLPKYSYEELCQMKNLDYIGRAERILSDFLPDFTKEEIKECLSAAYASDKFGGSNPAPLSLEQNGSKNMYFLELWHGPTSAFKDMALQLLPHLLTKSMKKQCPSKEAVILVATSGDTGKAALEGFKDVDGTKMIVFYPQNGVSPMQKLQMETQEGENVEVCGVSGNFDDAQTGVKKIFTDLELGQRLKEHDMLFSSANSINWGRLLPQIVYYFSSYCDLMNSGEIDYEGEKINIVVPTGNFGNILAAYYAKEMGLPVKKLICASNSNHVLTDFLKTGTYDRNREFYLTISPSMDILISSNLERLLYHLTGQDNNRVRAYMKSLSETGRYTVEEDVRKHLDELFYSGYCDDEKTKSAIKMMYDTENYLCDPHTAVAVEVYHEYVETTGDEETPTILVSTASPYKFSRSVLEAISGQVSFYDEFQMVMALSAITGTTVPEAILKLKDKPVRFKKTCSTASMQDVVLNRLRLR